MTEQLFMWIAGGMAGGYLLMWRYYRSDIAKLNARHEANIKGILKDHEVEKLQITQEYAGKLEKNNEDLRGIIVNNAVRDEKVMTLITNFNRTMEKFIEKFLDREMESSRSRG